jgi:hypothetical protein
MTVGDVRDLTHDLTDDFRFSLAVSPDIVPERIKEFNVWVERTETHAAGKTINSASRFASNRTSEPHARWGSWSQHRLRRPFNSGRA